MIMKLNDFVVMRPTLVLDSQKVLDVVESASMDFMKNTGLFPESAISVLHTPIYQEVSQNNGKVLLSGFGGDEFVSSYGATARIELFKLRQWQQWFSVFNGNFVTRRLRAFKWLIKYFLFDKQFETSRALTRAAQQMITNKVIRKDKNNYYGIEARLHKRAKYDAGYESINSFLINNRWSADVTSRLEDCTLAAASHGIEYRWPLLDIRLVEFFLAVPAQYKLCNGISRYLHRSAMRGLVPESIIYQSKEAGQNPVNNPNNSDANKRLKRDSNFQFDDFSYEKLPSELQAILEPEKWQKVVTNNKQKTTFSQLMQLNYLVSPLITLTYWLRQRKS